MINVVISGVNLVEGGILSVLHDALRSFLNLQKKYDIKITVLVHDTRVVNGFLDKPGLTFIQYPEVKPSWLKRIKFEYFDSKKISDELKPDMWLSLHDMTPNVNCNFQLVYCHNASPFYKLDVKRFFYDLTFSMFCLFYKYLYRVNIKKNKYVIVQQNWLRVAFEKMYGVNTIVAYPVQSAAQMELTNESLDFLHIDFKKTTFFYPSLPRVFKNFGLLCLAARELETRRNDFEIIVTLNGTENTYAEKIFNKYKDVKSIKFIGIQKRHLIQQLYDRVDCLVFPSKLESWGLPISEFKAFNKPILLADLPYAHENIGNYPKAKFFDPENAVQLSAYMELIIQNKLVFDNNKTIIPRFPFFNNWDDILTFLLDEAKEYKTSN